MYRSVYNTTTTTLLLSLSLLELGSHCTKLQPARERNKGEVPTSSSSSSSPAALPSKPSPATVCSFSSLFLLSTFLLS